MVLIPQLRLENNGDVIDVSTYLPDGFLQELGARGFGVAPTRLNIREGAGPGGRWKSTKRLTRDIDLPLIIFGDTRTEIKQKMHRLIKLLNDTFSVPTLYVVYPDEPEVFVNVHYGGGADPVFGVDTNRRTWARWTLTLRAPQPYWTSVQARNASLRAANSGRGLIKDTSLSKLRVSSSQTIGTFTIVNPGDVDAFPVWTIVGPGDTFAAHRVADGVGFTYDEPITNLNPITVDTRQKTVRDASGENMYGNLGTAPKLFSLPPGTSQVSVELTNSDSDSLVSLYFQPRYELVF